MIARRSTEARLDDILLWGRRVAIYIEGMDQAMFAADTKTQDAVIRCFENVGEAAGRILEMEPHLETDFPHVQLRQAYQMRNRLAHGYGSIDLDVIWSAALGSIPELMEGVRDLRDRRKG